LLLAGEHRLLLVRSHNIAGQADDKQEQKNVHTSTGNVRRRQ